MQHVSHRYQVSCLQENLQPRLSPRCPWRRSKTYQSYVKLNTLVPADKSVFFAEFIQVNLRIFVSQVTLQLHEP